MTRPKLPARRPRTPTTKSYRTSPTPIPSDKVIISIDPGWTTGVAVRANMQLATCVVYQDNNAILAMLNSCERVVIEKFETGGRLSTPGWYTISLVGEIVGYCKAKGIKYEIASPVQRYPFMKYAQAQVGGLIERSSVAKHEVDALAHLLAYEYRMDQDKKNGFTV